MRLENRVAIVTGGAGGIGRALSRRLVEHGARVMVADLQADLVDEAVLDVSSHGEGQASGFVGDCTQLPGLKALIARTEDWAGPVDLFFANAGVALGRGLAASSEDWTTSLEVNLLGHVRAAELLVPGWVQRQSGYFVSTASAAGLLTQVGSPVYSVTKHAAVSFAEWLAVTYQSHNIKVSCLCPMGVNTDMFRAGADSENELERLAARAVARSAAVLEPLQIADAVMLAIRAERFLILPHPEVARMHQQKVADVDRWITSMNRYQESLR